jgi:diacylglycerol kinase (ATP)
MQEHVLEKSPVALAKQTSAILIANPSSGSYLYQSHQIKETVTFLQQQGWQAELKLTQSADDTRKFAREAAAQHIDVVVAIGGDGTINEIIQELAGTETALGVLPSGTVNVWAREVGIPLDNAGARKVLLTGDIRRIDLGKINDHYFLLMASIGMDGEIIHAIEKKPAKRLGVLGYLLVGAWFSFGYSGFRASLQVDGRLTKAHTLQIVLGNTQLYGGAIKYTWKARCDDGLLDVCIVRKQGLLRRPQVVIDFILHREQRRQWVRYEKCTEIKIRTREPIAIQADGDPIGYTAEGFPPTTIIVAPGVLKVIVPEQPAGGLFVNPAEITSSERL